MVEIDDSVTFKPIVWSPEEIIDPSKLLIKDDLREFDTSKEPLITIFIGHVDSGKSTISG